MNVGAEGHKDILSHNATVSRGVHNGPKSLDNYQFSQVNEEQVKHTAFCQRCCRKKEELRQGLLINETKYSSKHDFTQSVFLKPLKCKSAPELNPMSIIVYYIFKRSSFFEMIISFTQ